MLTFYPSRIPDPGVKKAPNPGSATLAILMLVTSVWFSQLIHRRSRSASRPRAGRRCWCRRDLPSSDQSSKTITGWGKTYFRKIHGLGDAYFLCFCSSRKITCTNSNSNVGVLTSVADVFGPPGSWSVSTRYASGSGLGSFYHQAKKVRKTLFPIVLWLLYDFFFWKIM